MPKTEATRGSTKELPRVKRKAKKWEDEDVEEENDEDSEFEVHPFILYIIDPFNRPYLDGSYVWSVPLSSYALPYFIRASLARYWTLCWAGGKPNRPRLRPTCLRYTQRWVDRLEQVQARGPICIQLLPVKIEEFNAFRSFFSSHATCWSTTTDGPGRNVHLDVANLYDRRNGLFVLYIIQGGRLDD